MVDWRGASRAVAIGRLKVETRPMIMIQFQGKNIDAGMVTAPSESISQVHLRKAMECLMTMVDAFSVSMIPARKEEMQILLKWAALKYHVFPVRYTYRMAVTPSGSFLPCTLSQQ